MRSKEDAHDYRYFPDPDLLPLELTEEFVAACKAELPELPDAKRRRYEGELGLPVYNAAVITADVETARWFEALVEATGKPAVRSAEPPQTGLFRSFRALTGSASRSRIARSARSRARTAQPRRRRHAVGTLAKQVFEIHARNRR